MKSLYLILAAAAVVVKCKAQRISDAVIWYPSNDEDVFISLFGERRRTPPTGKWRNHRQARHTVMEPYYPYDPTENRDPSFFHNINERRLLFGYQPIPKLPPSFLSEPVPAKRPHKRPPGHEKPHKKPQEKPQERPQEKPQENFQNIFNEIFDYNKHPPVSEGPGATTSQWSSSQNQLVGPTTGNNNQRPWNQWESTSEPFGQRPTTQWGNSRPTTTGNNNQPWNQWESTSEPFGQRPTNQWGNSRPTTTGNNNQPWNQWESTSESFGQRPTTQWGSSRPVQRPTNGQLIDASKPSNRPTSQSDKLVFPGQELMSISMTKTTTTTATPFELIPTDAPTMSPCERTCPVTPEFNPVCGSDGVTYTNAGRLKCANMCGKNVRLSHYGNCGRPPLSTPLLSSTPRQKFKGFWVVDN